MRREEFGAAVALGRYRDEWWHDQGNSHVHLLKL
jgi:hypothetical protein